MTDAEARQLRNELDFLKRKVAAMEKKYGQLKGKSFLALVCSTEKGKSRRRLIGETLLIADPSESVTATNFLRSIERELVANATNKE